jgi:spastin
MLEMSKCLIVDEIDALLSERRSGEHEAVRRIKTEFLLQFEGMMTGNMADPGSRILCLFDT